MNLITKNTTFRSLFLCNIFNTLGGNLFTLAFLVYASTFPNSQFYLSLSAFLMVLPTLLNAFLGSLADWTKDKRRALFLTSWVQTALFVLVAILIEKRTLAVFIACVLINLLDELLTLYKSGLELPILQARLYENEIQPAFGLFQGSNSLIEIIGKPLGLALLALLSNSFANLALINAALYFLSGLVLLESRKFLAIPILPKKFHFSVKEVLGQIAQVFKSEQNSALVLILNVLLINFALNGILALIELAMIKFNPFGHNYGFAITAFNLAFSFGVLLSSLLMKDFFRKKSLSFMLSLLGIMLAIFSVSLLKFGLLALILLFAAGYCFAKINPKLTSLVFENAPKEELAAIRGGISTFFSSASALGVLTFVALANIIGVENTFYLIAMISLITLLPILFLKVKKIY